MNSFSRHTLSAYCVPGTVLDPEEPVDSTGCSSSVSQYTYVGVSTI